MYENFLNVLSTQKRVQCIQCLSFADHPAGSPVAQPAHPYLMARSWQHDSTGYLDEMDSELCSEQNVVSDCRYRYRKGRSLRIAFEPVGVMMSCNIPVWQLDGLIGDKVRQDSLWKCMYGQGIAVRGLMPQVVVPGYRAGYMKDSCGECGRTPDLSATPDRLS